VEFDKMAQVAQVVMAVGIIVSILISVRALREVRVDRRLSQKPHLMFEPGGHRFLVEIGPGGRRIAGVNPTYAEKALAALPEQSPSVRLKRRVTDEGRTAPGWYGSLKNYGSGPALDVKVQWVASQVWVGSEMFEVTEAKQTEPLYSRPLNTMPPMPAHIEAGSRAQLSRLPAFIVKDVDQKITRVEGHFEIRCQDVFGTSYVSKQVYHLFTGYADEPPHVHVTFSRLLT